MDFVARVYNAVLRDGLSCFFVGVRQCRDLNYIVYCDLRLFQDYQDDSTQEKHSPGQLTGAVYCQPTSDAVRRKTDPNVYFDSDSVCNLLRDAMPLNLYNEFMHQVLL